MSVTSATDPVATVVDLLDNAAAGDWTNSEVPDRIQRKEDSEPNERQKDTRLSQVSLYVWSPVEADLQKWSAEGETDQQETVRVDVMTNNATDSNAYAGDVVDILRSYTNDNKSQTEWVDIWPDGIDDSTSQGFYRSAFYPIGVTITLRRNVTEP